MPVFLLESKSMIVRIIIVLVAVVFFINGCNSLISQFFGTHKLRTFDMETVKEEGIGDADYVELDGAYLSGEYVHQPSQYEGEPPILLYAVLTAEELQQRQNGATVTPSLVAWTADFHYPCVDEGNCLEAGPVPFRGVVRDIPDANEGVVAKLKDKGYEIGPRVAVVNHGQAPIAWYWNLLMMLGPFGLVIGMEAYYNRKK
jgi:hypothetical protein